MRTEGQSKIRETCTPCFYSDDCIYHPPKFELLTDSHNYTATLLEYEYQLPCACVADVTLCLQISVCR